MTGNNIGLFFGSFNPVHNGHLMIANYMAEFGGLDQVWFVISPLNPFKTDADLLPDYHRRELLMRAIGEYQRFRVNSAEFKLPKPSYTIDTMAFLQKSHPDKSFSLIIGSDQLPKFHLWKDAQQILEKYNILVYPRHPSPVTSHILLDHPSVHMLNAPMLEISSTFIRQSIKEGKDVRFFMPDLAWQYIDEMHFYR